MENNNKLIITPLLYPAHDFETQDYSGELINKTTGVNLDYFQPSLCNDVDFILNKIKDQNDSPTRFFLSYKSMYDHLQFFLNQLEQEDRFEDCKTITDFITYCKSFIPSTKKEVRIQVEKASNREEYVNIFDKIPEDILNIYAQVSDEVIIFHSYRFMMSIIDNFWLWNEKMPLTQEYMSEGCYFPELMAKDIFKIYLENYRGMMYEKLY